MQNIIAWTIVILAVTNLVRMMFFMIGADIYDAKRKLAQRTIKKDNAIRPIPRWITVVVPAFNEELVIERCLKSITANDYRLKQIVVVDDGSTDSTRELVTNYQRKVPLLDLLYVYQDNQGKAAAINNAVANHSKDAEFIMVLDADSVLEPEAISNSVKQFADKTIMGLCANVRIIPDDSFLGLIQRFEYVISYRMKRALTTFNMEYILGGIASSFRKSAMFEAGLYDTDTITEDIDFTMKLLRPGNKINRVAYASDVIVHTEHVSSLYSLIRQRFRWKYGRFQTFYKHYPMFFNANKKYDKRLTWINLPLAIFGDMALFIEPIMVSFIFYISITVGDSLTLLTAYGIISTYIVLNVLAENTLPKKERVFLAVVAPALYLPMLVLTLVEFIALILSMMQFDAILLKNKQKHSGTWKPVQRAGKALPISS